MNTLECIHACPIDTMEFEIRDGMAYDGCFYYFTVLCTPAILKYDACFEQVEYTKTKRIYSCICYDPQNNCFWAASKGMYGHIYKLDCNLTEIDCLHLGCKFYGEITGLTYECCSKSLLISIGGCVFKIIDCGEKAQKILQISTCLITGVLSICPGLIVTHLKEGQKIDIYNGKGKLCDSLDVPRDFSVKNIVLDPCACDARCHKITLRAFALKKGCYPYLLTIKICSDSLGFVPDCCNFELLECCCECHPRPHDVCNDLMESIALVETSLSHILNAEGEKLQKVLAATEDIDAILCVNKEINQTIINATHLEHVLYNKLSAVKECCGTCKK